MQTDLSYGVLQEQHDTHASWLPRACLFRVFTSHRDNCDFPDNSFSPTAQSDTEYAFERIARYRATLARQLARGLRAN